MTDALWVEPFLRFVPQSRWPAVVWQFLGCSWHILGRDGRCCGEAGFHVMAHPQRGLHITTLHCCVCLHLADDKVVASGWSGFSWGEVDIPCGGEVVLGMEWTIMGWRGERSGQSGGVVDWLIWLWFRVAALGMEWRILGWSGVDNPGVKWTILGWGGVGNPGVGWSGFSWCGVDNLGVVRLFLRLHCEPWGDVCLV